MYRSHHLEVFKIGLVIIFSVATIPNTHASYRCPYKCKCSATTITCAAKELTDVPDFKKIISDPTTIDLSQNDIEEIKNLSFNYKRLEILINLKLHDNLIFDIQIRAFATLSKLQYLDLSNNLLEDFANDLIVYNKELKELNLAGNLFGTKTPILKSDSLEVLDYSFCKLSQFSKENVENLPNLRLLHLDANNLKELDPTIFGLQTRFIGLSFNTWKCQCETIQLFDHLVKNNLTIVTNPVQCIHSFRRYEDIYDSNGPIKNIKWCENKTETTGINNSTMQYTTKPAAVDDLNTSEESYIELKIWIGVVITVVVALISGVSLFVILRKQKTSRKNVSSQNTIYKELPTQSTFSHEKATRHINEPITV